LDYSSEVIPPAGAGLSPGFDIRLTLSVQKMALHDNVGVGDFVLLDKISMDQFIDNLQTR